MDQAEALSGLLPELRKIAPDILLYTGYTIEQLHGMKDENIEAALSQLSVLVDGEYIKKRNKKCFSLTRLSERSMKNICAAAMQYRILP